MKVDKKLMTFAKNLGKPITTKWNSNKYTLVGVRLPSYVRISLVSNPNDEFEMHINEIELDG